MRRSARLSRSSTLSSEMPVVDENNALVANSKDESDRYSSSSLRRSMRKSSSNMVDQPIQENLLNKIESIETEFKRKNQVITGDGVGWTEEKEGDDAGLTPDRSVNRESDVWNDVATPNTGMTPNSRNSMWKDVVTPTPAQPDVGESTTSDQGAPEIDIDVLEIDSVAKEVDKLDLNAEEIMNYEEGVEKEYVEVDVNRVSSLTEPDFEDTGNDVEVETDDIDELAIEINDDNREQVSEDQENDQEAVVGRLPAPPVEESSEAISMPPPGPKENPVAAQPSPITKPADMRVEDLKTQSSESLTIGKTATGEDDAKVPKRSSLNLSSMMTAKISKGLGQKHGGVDLTLSTNVSLASTTAVDSTSGSGKEKEKEKAPTKAPTTTRQAKKPPAVQSVQVKKTGPVIALRNRRAPIEEAVAAGINVNKKSVIAARAPGTVGVGTNCATVSSKASVVEASTASSLAGMRRPFAGSKTAVKNAFDTSLKPRQGQEPTAQTSVFLSREAVKAAKERAEEERVVKVAALKAKWAQEKKDKLQKKAAERQEDLERLNKLSAAAAAARKHALERKRAKEEERKQVEAEELAVKVEDRLHIKKVQEEDDRRRRRQSMALRSIMRERQRVAEIAIADQKEEQERSLLESRRQDAQLVRAYKEKEREDRRESLAMRGAEAQRQKQDTELHEQQRRDEEVDLLERRRAGWEDEQQYREELKAARRASMAGRLDDWRRQKAEAEQERLEQLERDVESLELRREDWKIREAAKTQEQHEQREETANRLDQWRKEKMVEAAWKAEDMEREALERELRAAELEDVHNYQAKLQDERRQSLAFRLDKSRIDAEHKSSQEQLEREIAAEEVRLKEQDREDVRAGKQAVIQSRRLSLEYRAQRAMEQKKQMEGETEYKKQMDAQDRELSEEAWRDVKRYQEKCRNEARKDLASVLLQQKQDYAHDLEMHQESLERLHEDMELRRKDWKAVKAAQKADGARRRRSIAMRLDSWRTEKLREAKKKVAELAKADEEARIREQDREALQRYKKDLQLSQLKADYTHSFVL